MKNKILLVMVAGAVAVGVLAPVGNADPSGMPKNVKSRYVSGGYNYLAFSSDEGLHYSVADPVIFDVEKQERWVSISIQDNSGRPTPARVGQDVDGDGELDETWDICGATDAPLEIVPGKDLQIAPTTGSCGSGVEPATMGMVFGEFFAPGRERLGGPSQKVTRDVTITYAGQYYEDGSGSFGGNAFRVERMPWERFVTVRAQDASGLPVLVEFYSEGVPGITVCSTSDKPIELPPGYETRVRVSSGACGQDPAVATTGQLELTLSNKP